jgi:stage IV sporulation protein FB
MTDPLTWSLNLGRWAGTLVRIHLVMGLYLGLVLLEAALDKGHPVLQAAGWLLMLAAALALHELGHAAMAARLAFDQEEVRIWPLGSLVGPSPTTVARQPEGLLVIAAGPITNLAFALVTYIGLNFAGAQPVFNPFGSTAGGAPFLADGKPAPPFVAEWWVGWFGYLNWVLFLANLIPAPPFDGGRFVRGALAVGQKDGALGIWLARGCALVLFLAGLIRVMFIRNGGSGLTLISLALLIEFMVRLEARMLEEGGYYDDGLFGYDFSQGYTSLEAGAPKVRPYRESALRRWRRRRSELRRQRREAKEAAEDRRMDEILEKLHREGRAALTDEEQRFLIRVSVKIRNRSKP